jgi:hypothetical protein
MLGHPTDCDFLGMVHGSMISNCPVTVNAVQNAHQIFGPDLAGIRGRMVRRPPESVTTDYVQIPRTILERHQLVTLAVDVMFVNGVPFLVSMDRGLNLVTAEFTPSRTAKQLAAGITRMIDLYSRGGFQVGMVLMDNEFDKLRNLVPILAINTTAANEHVPGHPEYPSVQENAQTHADRACIPCGAVAERIPGKLRSVRDTIPT